MVATPSVQDDEALGFPDASKDLLQWETQRVEITESGASSWMPNSKKCQHFAKEFERERRRRPI